MELVVDMAVVIMEVVEEVTVAALEMVDTEVELIEIFIMDFYFWLSADLVCDV